MSTDIANKCIAVLCIKLYIYIIYHDFASLLGYEVKREIEC